MKFNAFLKTVFLVFTITFVVSCDKDFNEIGADLFDDVHYNLDSISAPIVATNVATGVVQTSDLPINSLGYYNSGVFGATTANFVTQLELQTTNPKFYGRYNTDGTVNPSFKILSVYLYVPYFASATGSADSSTGETPYKLDSIHGVDRKLKLSVYRSGYFLRNLDLSTNLQEQQLYYSDQSSLIASQVIGSRLNNSSDVSQNDEFKFSKSQVRLLKRDADTGQVLSPEEVEERLAPGLYMDLDKTPFFNDVLLASESKLVDNNAFKNHFRGLYFQIQSLSNQTAMARLNFARGRIVIFYNGKTSENATTYTKQSLTLNLTGRTVNFFENVNSPDYNNAITNVNTTVGNSKLYIKGGQGSMAVLKLFGDADADNDGVADELENIRAKGWLINEANIVFHIDKASLLNAYDVNDDDDDVEFEPNRLMLYDLNNKKTLLDYSYDPTTNSLKPKYNKYVHDGIIQKVDGKGNKYKIRITNYIRSLLKNNDSTNVKLGLVVTESINIPDNIKLKNSYTIFGREVKYIPAMSVVSPLGTILWGNTADVPENKKLKFEIFYTKPD